VIPTAIHIAASEQIHANLLPALHALRELLERKARAVAPIVKLGRTHLMDATPLRMSDEWETFARQLAAASNAVEYALGDLLELPLGGTAVGTGLNSPRGFDTETVARLAAATGLEFRAADSKFDAISGHGAIVSAHGALRGVAVALLKIASDVRLLASGPRGGFGELALPANEPGSSIMPGKVNPTQCEALIMVCTQVIGTDVSVGIGGAGGQLQLNTFKPLLAYNLLNSIRWLTAAAESFGAHCVAGIEPNRATIQRQLEQSLMLVTALVPHIGYDGAARVARKAYDDGVTLREAALALAVIDADAFDAIVRPETMLRPEDESIPD